MRKFKNFALFALMGILFFSCGNKSYSEIENDSEIGGFNGTLKPSSTTISGDLGKYFNVVDGAAYVENDGIFGPIVSVKIEKKQELDPNIEEYDPVGYMGASVIGNYGFGIKICDENGNQIITVNASRGGMGGCYSSDDLISVWTEGVGENNVVRWSLDELDGKSGDYTFTITSFLEGTTSSSNETYTSSSSTGSTDVNALLNKMESLLNRLATMDEFSSEYESVEEEILILTDKLDDADMTSAQESRYFRLDDRFDNL